MLVKIKSITNIIVGSHFRVTRIDKSEAMNELYAYLSMSLQGTRAPKQQMRDRLTHRRLLSLS